MGLMQRINSLQKKVQSYNKKVADLNRQYAKEESAYKKAAIKIKMWGYRSLAGVLNRALSMLRSMVGKYNELKQRRDMAKRTKSIEERKRIAVLKQQLVDRIRQIFNWMKEQVSKIKEAIAQKLSQLANKAKSTAQSIGEKAKNLFRRGAETAEEVAKKAEKVHV